MTERARIWTESRRAPRKAPVEETEKQAIILACEALIRDVLTPRFLPEVKPRTDFNYPAFIHGQWHGGRYRFMTRYNSETPQSIVPWFDAPFARIDRVGPGQFDLYWHRHTGQWWPIASGLTLEEALRRIVEDGVFIPC